MADLTPERREELTRGLHALGGCKRCQWAHEDQWPCGSADRFRDQADALAPLIAGWLAAEREAGAAEVRARVEVLADEWERDASSVTLRHGLLVAADDLRAALNGGES